MLVDNVDNVDLMSRGAALRRHKAFGVDGANVNFVQRAENGFWRYRTFERGVEGETLACGTGSVATAVLLAAWGLAESPIRIITSSSKTLTVTLRQDSPGADFSPSLRGEGRVVFRGEIQEISAHN